MVRLLTLSLIFACSLAVSPAQEPDGPPIAITSPDTATTFTYGSVKHHALLWDNATQTLVVEVSFVDEQQDSLQAGDDTHEFRLPGITRDRAHGIFYAKSAQGEAIPVARVKKTLFVTSIEPTDNAIVHIQHRHGAVSVTLEAIRPADLAKQKMPASNSDGTHSIDLRQLLP